MAKPKNIGDEIHRLRNLGYSYNKIADELKCSKSNVCYHLGIGQKIKSFKRSKKNTISKKLYQFLLRSNYIRKNHIILSNKTIIKKIFYFFRCTYGNDIKMSQLSITTEQIIEKFGNNPKCYLTGKELDWSDSSSYSFDHVIPVSQGGESNLDNLQVCDTQVNFCKNRLTPEQFIELCKQVVQHQGYQLIKTE